MDVRQALLDARVAEAAEAWLADPRDVEVYRRLISAVAERRRAREGYPPTVAATFPEPSAQAALDGAPPRPAQSSPQSHASADGSRLDDGACLDDARLADDGDEGPSSDVGSVEAWPRVRPVGADLAGDPAAVLRRLRGG